MRFATLALLALLSTSLYGQNLMEWPDLDNVKFISGRHAVEEDINSGAAVFLLQSENGEYLGSPIDIDIPQYALHKDESGAISKVVVIQAEQANEQKAIGAINIADGSYMVGLFNEFELLGIQKPNQ